MPSYTLEIPKDTELHKKLIKKISSRIKLGEQEQQVNHDKWRRAEDATMAFLPESEADAVRRNRRDLGEPRYTTIQIPYTYAVLMSQHTYWTSVFFSRAPVHQFSGRHGEGEQQIQAMEALIDYQVQVGGALVPYYVWLYDTGKYGGGVLGEYWCREKLHYGQLVTMVDSVTGKETLNQVTQETIGYLGNRCYNVSPWDFIFDPRVSFKNFQNGEFCAARCRLAWHQIVQRRDGGYYNSNVDLLKDHLTEDKSAKQNSSALTRPTFQWKLSEDGDATNDHPAGAIFWEFYVELIPSEWGIGNTNFPQKWCFTITEDLGLIVGASPLGMVHCKFPFNVLEAEVEGYGIHARGTPEILTSVQNTVDWLVNTHFFNVRQTLNNQFIVDPSKLVIKDMQNSGPGFIWRLRPEAYGTDLTKIFMQVPTTDVTRGHMADFQSMLGLGERITGVNDQIMGALQTGTRKTATEVRTTTSFGVNRQKTVTEYMCAMGFQPHAQKLVQNSQQFYDVTAKLRRVGSFALEAGPAFVNVTPEDIIGFFDLVPIEGTLPVDRFAQFNLWKEIFANFRMLPPQVAMGYDWGRMFAWAANLGGLKNIQQFRVQVMPDQMLQQQAQQGNSIPLAPPNPAGNNVIPMPGRTVTPGQSASTAAGLNAMGGEGGPQQL